MSLAIANRYARALADVALTDGSGLDPAAALDQLSGFASLVRSSEELRNALLSPAVSISRKHAVISRLGETMGLHRIIRNFLYVTIDHRRSGQIDEIATAFQAVLDDRLGRVRAHVRSAQAIPDAQQQRLEAELSRLSGKTVQSEFQVDLELLGGANVRIGSTIYDGSVRGALDQLRQRLVPR